MDLMTIFGLIASAALLFAFAMLNLDKWTPDDYYYQFLNFIGAGFLAASAGLTVPFNAGVFWTELIWSLIGLYGIYKIWSSRRKAPTEKPLV